MIPKCLNETLLSNNIQDKKLQFVMYFTDTCEAHHSSQKNAPPDQVSRHTLASEGRVHAHHGDGEELLSLEFIKDVQVLLSQLSVNSKERFVGRILGSLIFLQSRGSSVW